MGRSYEISDFYCVGCGHKGIPIPRRGNKFKEAGHLKKLYCIYCQKQTNHCEIRPVGHYTYENFQYEKQAGHFNSDGTRLVAFSERKEN